MLPDLTPVTDVLIWIVMGGFVAGIAVDRRDRTSARSITALAWLGFALFWLLMVPFFVFDHRSIVEAILASIAVPACIYVALRLHAGRDSLLTLSRAVGVMGLIYLPFGAIPIFHDTLIEIVANQTHAGLQLLGSTPAFETDDAGLRNTFAFTLDSGRRYSTRIVFACTGIGSMAIFGGLIAAVCAPIERRLAALALALSTIWILNVARNVFIAYSIGHQLFDQAALAGPVMWLFGVEDPIRVSFFVADRILSQGLAVVALLAIAWAVVKVLPELYVIVEDLAYLVTGEEYDLGGERA
ncbi:transmembrane exosortase EpsH [Halalkalicoccus paucihalophilus]|uniref:Transmembrane exosortase EpsH n=1 Tax=Halalkalicoccus paucihalophilus TaxID=1008153 RepID=A0A151AK59_9EURY|nr:archaeosortase A [Halalkalicoccus paucihalophilus]KYH27797.1 transmembrane exosortase EpsH [Halalkalicoccus paucihalophilus]